MSKFRILFFISAILVFCSSFYLPKKNRLPWNNCEKTSELFNKEKKPIIVDIYTDWCHYCHVMDETVYANNSVSNYILKKFYPTKINAEEKNQLLWMGKKYYYMSQYKVHELAVMLTKGNLVYPSTIIIPETGEPMIIGGAISINEMESRLKFYGTTSYKTMSYEQFLKTFSAKWK